MQGVVLGYQERLEGDTVDEQGHRGELDVQHVMMPFLITRLRLKEREDREQGEKREDQIRQKIHRAEICGVCYARKKDYSLTVLILSGCQLPGYIKYEDRVHR